MIENKYEISKDLEKHYRYWSRLVYAEVISYNKNNLKRELQNGRQQHDNQQGKVKRREEEI